MAGAKAADVAKIVLGLLDGAKIPYVAGGVALGGMDCQGLVKYCVRQAGGKCGYSGSNAMYRACLKAGTSWTLADARKTGKLVPGALVFILELDGKEPAAYKADGAGNASHVGVYAGASDAVWSVDASMSAGQVRGRTKRDAGYVWTHVGWMPGIEYGDGKAGLCPPPAPSGPEPNPGGGREGDRNPLPEGANATWFTLQVKTPGGGALNLRRAPTTQVDNRVGRANDGETLAVLEQRADGWSRVKYRGIEAWAQSVYLRRVDGEETV